jgi:hypothetical protein
MAKNLLVAISRGYGQLTGLWALKDENDRNTNAARLGLLGRKPLNTAALTLILGFLVGGTVDFNRLPIDDATSLGRTALDYRAIMGDIEVPLSPDIGRASVFFSMDDVDKKMEDIQKQMTALVNAGIVVPSTFSDAVRKMNSQLPVDPKLIAFPERRLPLRTFEMMNEFADYCAKEMPKTVGVQLEKLRKEQAKKKKRIVPPPSVPMLEED